MLLRGRKGGWGPALMRSFLFGPSEGGRVVRRSWGPGPTSVQREEEREMQVS